MTNSTAQCRSYLHEGYPSGQIARRAPSGAIDDALSLAVLDVTVAIQCADPGTRSLLTAHYGQMRRSLDTVDVNYAVAGSNGDLLLTRDGADTFTAADRGELLWVLDQDVIIQLQKQRQDLYFIHAAVLEVAGKAFMLVAPSGGGKSTTAWALSHHGFRYLSDELGVVDLATLDVHPYPRALLLKSMPPTPYALMSTRLSTSRGMLIRAETLAGGIRRTPAPLHAIFFLRYPQKWSAPSLRRMSVAEGGARLYAHVLNALAHRDDGLDAAIQIAHQTSCFELSTGDLARTCALVKTILDQPSLAAIRRTVEPEAFD